MSACSTIGFSGGRSGASVTRDSQGLVFEAKYPTRAYRFADKNTADVYLTDLSDAELSAFFTESQDWSPISGSLVRVHLFLSPKPGNTPIEPTAASAAIRWIVITNGEIGVYDGAGFMIPGRNITKGSISGSIRNAPMKLTRQTVGFFDPLVTPEMDVKFGTKLDEQSSDELAARFEALAARALSTQD
ncbi:MAG: hypothetical protein AB8C13_09905 [Phycisphaerales bacterium]